MTTPVGLVDASAPPLSSTLSKTRLASSPGKVNRSIAAWSVGRDLGLEAVLERDAVVVRPRDLVRRGGTASARALRSASGVPVAADGMTWKVWRSPIHGLGSWLARERLQRRQVVRVVGALVLVQPAQRARVGHRRPEVEAVRHRGGREVVAAREAAAGVGAAGGDRRSRTGARVGCAGPRAPIVDVVDPAAGTSSPGRSGLS